MNDQPKPSSQGTINLESVTDQIGKVDVNDFHVNVGQKYIVITEDKVRLCLTGYLEKMGKKNNWIAPLGIFLTIIATLFTSSFKTNIPYFNPDALKAIFVIAALLCFLWLIRSIKEAWLSPTVDNVIEELKKITKEEKEKKGEASHG